MRRLLVVDDDKDVATALTRVLRRADGLLVETAYSGGEALLKLAEWYDPHHMTQAPPTLVLSDVDMPGMSGLHLARTIKENLEHYVLAPVVVLMSGAVFDRRKREAAEAGAVALLDKPINDLRSLVETYLRTVVRYGMHYGAGVTTCGKEVDTLRGSERATIDRAAVTCGECKDGLAHLDKNGRR